MSLIPRVQRYLPPKSPNFADSLSEGITAERMGNIVDRMCHLVHFSGLAELCVHLAYNRRSPSFLDFARKISHHEPFFP
jgi:hypothetical protein